MYYTVLSAIQFNKIVVNYPITIYSYLCLTSYNICTSLLIRVIDLDWECVIYRNLELLFMYCMLTDITGVINNPKYIKYNEICLVFIRYKYLISPIEIALS